MKRSIILILLCLFTNSCTKNVYYYYQIPPQETDQEKFDKALAEAKKRKPEEKPIIVIDAGHGGKDAGAESKTKPNYQEKYLNLTTSQLLKSYLQKIGLPSTLTRTDDTFIPLKKRANIANSQKPRLFVSVHYNSAPSKKAEGVEIYYYKSESNPERTKKSKLLAQHVLDKVIQNTKAKSRGIKHGNFAVIRETEMPAILIEGGFMSNSEELNKLKEPKYLQAVARGITQGIRDYLSESSHY